MAEPRRIAVVGTGAMAMLFGARLARGGHSVTLWGTWEEGLRAMRTGGIRVEGERGVWRAEVEARRLTEAGDRREETASLALVLVKSHQNRRVGGRLASLVGGHGRVLSLQNGLGNGELLAAAARPVAVGVTTAAASVLAPGSVREVSTGSTVLAAEQEPEARLLSAAGFEIAISCDVRPHLWLKLAVNCAINPVTALAGIRNGELLERPEARRLAVAAASEVAEVAAASGIRLPADPTRELLRVARVTAGNVSSMLQDLRRGAPTEIDALCGAVVRRGAESGVPTPVNEELWRGVGRRLQAPAALGVRT